MAGLTLHQLVSAAVGQRHELGLSQAQLAERLGRSRRWVQSFEQGHGEASLVDALRLLAALGLELTFVTSDESVDTSDEHIDLGSLLDEHRS